MGKFFATHPVYHLPMYYIQIETIVWSFISLLTKSFAGIVNRGIKHEFIKKSPYISMHFRALTAFTGQIFARPTHYKDKRSVIRGLIQIWS